MPARKFSATLSSPTRKLDFTSPTGKTAVEFMADEEESESLLGPGTAASIYSHTKVKTQSQKTKKQRTWQGIFALSLLSDVGLGCDRRCAHQFVSLLRG